MSAYYNYNSLVLPWLEMVPILIWPNIFAVLNKNVQCRLVILQLSRGYTNWKDAPEAFKKHTSSNTHTEAVEKLITLPATTRDVGELLSASHAKEKEENRKHLMQIICALKYLARQSLAIRGDGMEEDGNLMQLMQVFAEKDPSLRRWMSKKANTYLSHDMQNEIVEVMAMQVLRNIVADIQKAPFFTVMVDETTDKSNEEQAVIVIRWVDDTMEAHEEFIGLYKLPSIDAETIFKMILDVLKRLNLSTTKIRGQCYDGASSMSGKKSGVSTRFLDLEPRALYTHCYGHALNLAVSDALKGSKVMKNALFTTHEVTKLIKLSPRRDVAFKSIKVEISPGSPGIRILCPTRWTVRADALASILQNYPVLMETWVVAADLVKDSETTARINGVAAQMSKFDFLFGAMLGEKILRPTDQLSQTLQKVQFSASDGQHAAKLTLEHLQQMRSDAAFNDFWTEATNAAQKNGVDEPVMPCQRKVPRRYEQEGVAAHEFPSQACHHYHQIYNEALDSVMARIRDRFDQAGYRTYRCLEDLLLKSATQEDTQVEMSAIADLYKEDFKFDDLKSQLAIMGTSIKAARKEDSSPIAVTQVIEYVRNLSPCQQDIMPQVVYLIKLILVMPATNATSERSFSALKRVKTYLRATMTQKQLNHLMVLHVHKSSTDRLEPAMIGNQFVAGSEH